MFDFAVTRHKGATRGLAQFVRLADTATNADLLHRRQLGFHRLGVDPVRRPRVIGEDNRRRAGNIQHLAQPEHVLMRRLACQWRHYLAINHQIGPGFIAVGAKPDIT